MSETRTSERVLYYIIEYKKENNELAPSRREIGEKLGIGLATVNYNIEKLVADGRLLRVPGIARALAVVEEATPDSDAVKK